MKKLSAAGLLLSALLMISGCAGSKVMTKEEIIKLDDPFIQEMAGIDRGDFIKSWGEPFATVGNTDVWEEVLTGENKYIAVTYDETQKSVCVNRSYPLFVIVIDEERNLGLFSDNGFEKINAGDMFFIPADDYFGNAIDIKNGDKLFFEYSGLVMETYPAQIAAPYSSCKLGTASDEEMKQIEECVRAYDSEFNF